MTGHTVLWIVGPPGVGKTSLVRRLLGFPSVGIVQRPKWTIATKVPRCAAGWYTGARFDGADTVPYNGASEAISFWSEHLLGQTDVELTIFDGDRFSNASALSRVEQVLASFGAEAGVCACVHMRAPPDVLAARRAQRGSAQDEAWARGRATKAANFASMFLRPAAVARKCYDLDAAKDQASLVSEVERQLRSWSIER